MNGNFKLKPSAAATRGPPAGAIELPLTDGRAVYWRQFPSELGCGQARCINLPSAPAYLGADEQGSSDFARRAVPGATRATSTSRPSPSPPKSTRPRASPPAKERHEEAASRAAQAQAPTNTYSTAAQRLPSDNFGVVEAPTRRSRLPRPAAAAKAAAAATARTRPWMQLGQQMQEVARTGYWRTRAPFEMVDEDAGSTKNLLPAGAPWQTELPTFPPKYGAEVIAPSNGRQTRCAVAFMLKKAGRHDAIAMYARSIGRPLIVNQMAGAAA